MIYPLKMVDLSIVLLVYQRVMASFSFSFCREKTPMGIPLESDDLWRKIRWLKSPEHTVVMADEEKKILVFIRSGREAQRDQEQPVFGHSSHRTAMQQPPVD